MVINGYHIFNTELKSHDSFVTLKEAQELVEHFMEDGYKQSDIKVVRGLELPIKPTIVDMSSQSTRGEDK